MYIHNRSNGNNFLAENRAHLRYDKHRLETSPACTDAATTQSALDAALELSVHAGNVTKNEICVGEGLQ
jgi:hypothetical protein